LATRTAEISGLHTVPPRVTTNRSTPAVFVQVGDPVGSGFLDELSRPGGNLTAFSTSDAEMGGKWVQMLTEIAPTMSRIAIIYDSTIQGNLAYLPSAQSAARIHDIKISTVAVRDLSEIGRAMTEFAREPHGGLVVLPSPLTGGNRDAIARLATAGHLPAIYAFRSYVMSGGLLSYGPDPLDLFRRAASYVDRILKGDKPADLPVQHLPNLSW
jgi:putative ABC transport system substrate-binding protein